MIASAEYSQSPANPVCIQGNSTGDKLSKCYTSVTARGNQVMQFNGIVGSMSLLNGPLNRLWAWAAIACLLTAFAVGCSGESPSTEPDAGSSETAASPEEAPSGPLGWTLLPQFPPREQVISRRLLGINDVQMLDANIAWVVGTDGAIGKTTDGGGAFTVQKSGTAINLTGVWFVDTSNGWAVGTAGTVLRTSDGGATWEILPSVQGVFAFESVYFKDTQSGWAAADFGAIYRTSDGGGSWSEQDSGTSEDLLDIVFLPDGSKAWSVGYGGAVVHSSDGGETWSSQESGTDGILNAVTFANDTFGIAVGAEGLIIRTTDGGGTWSNVESGLTEDLFGVFFLNENEGWAVGARSKVIHSSDGGVTWSEQETITSGDSLRGVMFTSSDNGLAGGSGGRIWKYGPITEQ